MGLTELVSQSGLVEVPVECVVVVVSAQPTDCGSSFPSLLKADNEVANVTFFRLSVSLWLQPWALILGCCVLSCDAQCQQPVELGSC